MLGWRTAASMTTARCETFGSADTGKLRGRPDVCRTRAEVELMDANPQADAIGVPDCKSVARASQVRILHLPLCGLWAVQQQVLLLEQPR